MPEDLKIDRRTLLKTAVSAGAAAAAPAVLAADANAVRWSEVHDVVIAGAGGAGLAAAVMAGGISKDVVVLEKTQDVGGNTRLADAFNAVDPAVQKPLGIEDSPELHARQMLETGRWCADPKLVETVATGAPRALAWLKELGVRFEPDVYQVYGSLWPRTHSPSEPEGSGYIHPLLFKCRELGVSIRTGTKVCASSATDSRAPSSASRPSAGTDGASSSAPGAASWWPRAASARTPNSSGASPRGSGTFARRTCPAPRAT